MSKQPHFYFRNIKRDKWDTAYKSGKRIMYKRMEVGQIQFVDGGFQLRFIGNASPEQLASNPNCLWSWRIFAKRFDTVQEALDFITIHAEKFYNRLFDGIKDETFNQ